MSRETMTPSTSTAREFGEFLLQRQMRAVVVGVGDMGARRTAVSAFGRAAISQMLFGRLGCCGYLGDLAGDRF
jgi:hypothetical protein